jgi:fructokinase
MIAMADIVKLSDEDLAWFGESGSTDEIIARWLDLGPKLILLTQGGKGATGYSKRHKVTITPQPVQVVDTVGAGDTFNAGALASLQERGALTKERIAALSDAEIRSALELGTAAAAITVSRAGANPPWRHELG